MSNIPVARKALEELKSALESGFCTDGFALDQVELALNNMTRKRYKELKASRTSNKITAELRDSVLLYMRANPNAANHVIAKHFGINQGRVSEIIAGKYANLRRRSQC